jgi:hypothetical protein
MRALSLDDTQYAAVCAGGKKIRTRQPGDLMWHSHGVEVPNLTNVGGKACRTLVVNLKTLRSAAFCLTKASRAKRR